MRGLIDMAADRGAFIDQSQSLNLFVENPNIGALSSMYFYAWKKGLKTTYYLRSRPGDAHRQGDRGVGLDVASCRSPAAAQRRWYDRPPDSSATAAATTPPSPAPSKTLNSCEALPVSAVQRVRQSRLLDPGLCLTPAPDGLPAASSRCTATASRTPGPSKRSTSPPTSPTCAAR